MPPKTWKQCWASVIALSPTNDLAELTVAEPFRERGPVRGRQLPEVVRKLSQDVSIDVMLLGRSWLGLPDLRRPYCVSQVVLLIACGVVC